MRTAQVGTALLVAILSFSGWHALMGHRWYGWHHRHGYGYGCHDRCDGYEHHHRHWHDREMKHGNSFEDTTYRLQ